jgi:hypothetical protein
MCAMPDFAATEAETESGNGNFLTLLLGLPFVQIERHSQIQRIRNYDDSG